MGPYRGGVPDPGFRARLDRERARVASRVDELQHEFEAVVAAACAANLDDEHDPEGATIGFERAQLTALSEQGRRHLAEIDDALDRMRAGTYGTCVACGLEIGSVRLAALPTATQCVHCAGADTRR
jgi:RNA polymerase-binding transcription factor DksA